MFLYELYKMGQTLFEVLCNLGSFFMTRLADDPFIGGIAQMILDTLGIVGESTSTYAGYLIGYGLPTLLILKAANFFNPLK